MDIIPDIFDFSLLRGLASDHCFGNRRCIPDDGVVSNQSIVYRGDPWVIAPSRSSSLRRTTSTVNLGEDSESALRRGKDARPGLGFGLELSGAITGEGSPPARYYCFTPVLVVLVLDLHARSLQLQYRMMRSFHPERRRVANSQPSTLCHRDTGNPCHEASHRYYVCRGVIRLWKGGSADNRGEVPPIQARQLKLDEVLTGVHEN